MKIMATKTTSDQLSPKEISRINAREDFMFVILLVIIGSIFLCTGLELIKVWFLQGKE